MTRRSIETALGATILLVAASGATVGAAIGLHAGNPVLALCEGLVLLASCFWLRRAVRDLSG